MATKSALVRLPALVSSIERRIYSIHGHRVMLDIDLAELYGVPTKRLNEQVKRNFRRFPKDFMFRLTPAQGKAVLALRSQFATLKRGQHRKYAPYVFTEQGVAMLSSVLNSERAITVNIAIMRAFVRMREIATHHRDLARKLKEMEKKYDTQFRQVFDAIHQLLEPPLQPIERRHIGFVGQGKHL